MLSFPQQHVAQINQIHAHVQLSVRLTRKKCIFQRFFVQKMLIFR